MEKVLDQVILEQFMKVLPEGVQSWVKRFQPISAGEDVE